MDKNALKDRVLEQLIALEVSKGHLKWKVTDLARLSRVSRPLIYYHFGRTKREILDRGFGMLVDEVYGFSAERTAEMRRGNLAESLRRTRAMFLAHPEYAILYLKWRTGTSPMRARYAAIEKRYQRRLGELYPRLDAHEIEALHALLHGIATAPFLSDAGASVAAEWVARLVRKG